VSSRVPIDLVDLTNRSDSTDRSTPIPRRSTQPSRTALWLGFLTLYLVWGSTYLGIRICVESMPPFLMAGARFAVAGVA